MFTRKQYLNKECSHREYYGQFVTPRVLAVVKRQIGTKAINNSTDPHLNDIPLSKWDAVFFGGFHNDMAKIMRDLGDFPTLAGGVCIAKEAAKQIKTT